MIAMQVFLFPGLRSWTDAKLNEDTVDADGMDLYLIARPQVRNQLECVGISQLISCASEDGK